MPALDTNVLVRYLVQDDSGQLAAARRLIGRCVSEGQSLFVPVTVTLELEWVLRASFGYAKDEVLQALSNLFSAAELTFESERALKWRCAVPRVATSRLLTSMRPSANNRCGPSQRRPVLGARYSTR